MKRLALGLLGLLVFVAHPRGYATYASWASNAVPYYINPTNLYVPTADAITDLQAAADAWHLQTTANIQFTYVGTSTKTAAALDYQNVVLFNAGADPVCTYCGAETVYNFDGTGHLLDTDMVIYEANYTYFVNNTGCSGNGEYIQDSATHEFGHMLGMGHSAVTTATMYPTNSYCDLTWESLDADDLAGILSIYPSGTIPPPTNTAPVVSITKPTNGASYQQGVSVTFTGTATDTQDGSLTSGLAWTDSLQGLIGTGATFATSSLIVGSHVIIARVSDTSGLAGTAQVSVKITAPKRKGRR